MAEVHLAADELAVLLSLLGQVQVPLAAAPMALALQAKLQRAQDSLATPALHAVKED